MRLEIEKTIDMLRPMLQADGGDVSFVDYFNRIVYVKLTGACEGCPHANVTIKNGIEAKLIEQFPEEVREVRDMTFEDLDL
ncbi:MAG: NifU family protein [Proteobacteria bacterium]|nr:NifU family protein [Pseudomonadota bacterium]